MVSQRDTPRPELYSLLPQDSLLFQPKLVIEVIISRAYAYAATSEALVKQDEDLLPNSQDGMLLVT